MVEILEYILVGVKIVSYLTWILVVGCFMGLIWFNPKKKEDENNEQEEISEEK